MQGSPDVPEIDLLPNPSPTVIIRDLKKRGLGIGLRVKDSGRKDREGWRRYEAGRRIQKMTFAVHQRRKGPKPRSERELETPGRLKRPGSPTAPHSKPVPVKCDGPDVGACVDDRADSDRRSLSAVPQRVSFHSHVGLVCDERRLRVTLVRRALPGFREVKASGTPALAPRAHGVDAARQPRATGLKRLNRESG